MTVCRCYLSAWELPRQAICIASCEGCLAGKPIWGTVGDRGWAGIGAPLSLMADDMIQEGSQIGSGGLDWQTAETSLPGFHWYAQNSPSLHSFILMFWPLSIFSWF